MKKIIYISGLIIVTMFCSSSFAGEKFKPWGAKLNVGDEKIRIVPLIKLKTVTKKNKKKQKIRTVFNGVQGGAYFLIRFFQVVISPQDGPSCRYNPTCSAYGKHAVEKHGALLGAIMAGERLIRCNPYNPPGKDPVPENFFGNN